MRIKPIKINGRSALIKQLPQQFVGKANIFGEGTFALVNLGEVVVHSSVIQKAIRKTPEGCQLVVSARDITIEANELLSSVTWSSKTAHPS